MKRVLPAFAVALALSAPGALAGWQPFSVTGTPVDLQLTDAGHVVFATSAGGFGQVYAPDGGVQDGGSVTASSAVGAWHDFAHARIGALEPSGQLVWSSGAPMNLPDPLSFFQRMRHTSSGMGYAISVGGAGPDYDFSPSGGADGGWDALVDNTPSSEASGFVGGGFSSVPLSCVRAGGADYALIGGDLQGRLALVVDAGIELIFRRGLPAVRDVHLYANGTSPGAFIVPGDGGLESVSNIAVGDAGFVPVTLPAGSKVRAVAFSLEEAGSSGRGFGVATGTVGGTETLLRAIPDPAGPGKVWVSAGPPPASGTVTRVGCVGASFCAATISGPPPDNVLVYWNQSAPSVAPFSISTADTVPVTFTADAGDSDGDPVFVSWTGDAGTQVFLTVLSADGKTVTFVPDAGAFCGTSSSSFPFQVLASDGLASHESSAAGTLTVTHAPPATPSVDLPDASVAAGASSIQFTARYDGGACPVTFEWSETTDAGFGWSAAGASLTVTPPAETCAPGTGHAQFEVRAAEGALKSPAAAAHLWVTYSGGGPPEAPSLNPSGVVPTDAGGGPVQVQLTPGDAGTLCGPAGFAWTQVALSPALADSGFQFEIKDGGSVEFTPPEYLCSPVAGTASYQVRASNLAGTSPAVGVTFSVGPWGAPFAPVFAPVVQEAGTTVGYPSLDAGHFCANAPVSIEAQLLDGGPAGIQVSTDSGTRIDVRAPECIDAVALIQGRHRVGGTGAVSAWSDLEVSIATVLTPLGMGFGIEPEGGSGQGYDPSSGEYRGTLTLGANCIDRRQLSAVVEIARSPDGGDRVGEKTFLVPPLGFNVPMDGGCAGGQFFVTARLVDDAGTTGVEATESFVTDIVPPRLGEISGDELVAVCGRGASGGLQMAPPTAAGYCPTQTILWEQVDGPALEQPVMAGTNVPLKTVATGFDELLGRQVRLRVTASAGPGNASSTEKAVTITGQSFVTIRHTTDSPVVNELGIVTISVALTNDSECGVTGASYDEQLDGLRYVTGTARLDGRPVEAFSEAGVLHVSELELSARTTHVLVYSARPPLLGRPAPRGMAQLRGVSISESDQGLGDPRREPAPGCACAGVPAGGLAWLGLVALALWRGRRARASR